jgi:hypothetical protein
MKGRQEKEYVFRTARPSIAEEKLPEVSKVPSNYTTKICPALYVKLLPPKVQQRQ